MAADIETLIRQALARQNGFDPQVRAKIYQSSRNALAKMIAKSGMVPPDIIEARNKSLETTINTIELEFTAKVNQQNIAPQNMQPSDNQSFRQDIGGPATSPPSVSIPDAFDPGPKTSDKLIDTIVQPAEAEISPPVYADSTHAVADETSSSPEAKSPEQFSEPTNMEPAHPPQPEPSDYAEPTPHFARPRRKPFRYVVWITALAILIIVGWIAFMITKEILEPDTPKPVNGETSDTSAGNGKGNFVTILEPDQPSALVTNGNGTATILSDTSQPAIRIVSLRQENNRDAPAEPMLLELPPGVLKNIAGKKATVEIRAKSGDSGPATFSVTCRFGELGECGRKRFRIGLQPEAVIFSIQISKDYREGQRAFLAINTDVTSAAALSGKGARIDVIYARIRTESVQ